VSAGQPEDAGGLPGAGERVDGRDSAEAVAALLAVDAELNARAPETDIEPTLQRIAALLDILGNPQRGYPIIHIAGTNGKTSVTRMAEQLLHTAALRTGRYTSPHLQRVTERIALDTRPISAQGFLDAYHEVMPYLPMVDEASAVPLSKFEVLTAMAFATFADAPVDAAVIETGLGGRWDATNVVDSEVAVIGPVGVDHVEYLGSDLAGIAAEKAGIVKPETTVVLAKQPPEAAEAVLRRCLEVDATVARQDSEFGVVRRDVAVGGQLLTLQGLGGRYDDLFLPLHGAHQADNACLAVAAVEALLGAGAERKLDVELVREAFAEVRSPGRLEPVRSAPTVLLDAAHNPHGAAATAAAISEEFGFRKLVGVVGVMADKDAAGMLGALEPVLSEVVVTRNSTRRSMEPAELAETATAEFGPERVYVQQRLDDALETAIAVAEEVADADEPISGAGVLVTGSVVTVGEARALFGKEPE
jgi:dihydrofolate synthase/folylpolyglutamate synthase